MRVRVNPELCRGHGVCCSYAPDVFETDENGKAVVIVQTVPALKENDVYMAVETCPEQAIEIVPDS